MTIDRLTNDRSALSALCILGQGPEGDPIREYLKERRVHNVQTSSLSQAEKLLMEPVWDVVILDADVADGDINSFFKLCWSKYQALPIVAVHDGRPGRRGTALIRMGAFDAFPRDMGRWDTDVYLDRALEQSRIIKRLLSLSRTDHLTRLFNQRFFFESLEREVIRSERAKHPFSLALLDLDQFKKYNDSFGHIEGNNAMSTVARIIKNSIREGQDSGYRFGGDEFMILLPETQMAEALEVLERILENMKKEAPSGLTFSTGIAFVKSCSNVKGLIKAVDRAMYQAKRAGGNGIFRIIYDNGGNALKRSSA